MKFSDESSSFYNEVINLIDLHEHETAIKVIKKNIHILRTNDDIALAYLNCGFLNDKLGDHAAAIEDFSRSISIESELEIINQRSKDISLSGRSNSSYKNRDYQNAIEDKREAKKIRLFEYNQFSGLKNIKIDYKKILLGTFDEIDLEPKFNTLIKASKIIRSKYDLIADYKKVISEKKIKELIKKLENLSDFKYKIGDYKASIIALRRAEKYY